MSTLSSSKTQRLAELVADKRRRGIIHPQAAFEHFTLDRYPPGSKVAYFVEGYWRVSWDLQGRPPFVQETVSHPFTNLVFEKGGGRLYGVATRRFSRRLVHRGQVIAVKFRMGGLYPFLRVSLARFTDLSLPARALFGEQFARLDEQFDAQTEPHSFLQRVEEFICQRLPGRDPNVDLVNRIFERILSDSEVYRVDTIADHFRMNKRALQRLFQRYVGVGPKWVIQRHRLQEALSALDHSPQLNLTALSHRLGYFDQSHFTRDFKALVGISPERYRQRSLRASLPVGDSNTAVVATIGVPHDQPSRDATLDRD
ncbi:MAG TPA: helix-turn-helix domain-containing protein [Polyangiaceae bacterium]|nr:helix-turn-helix domain-containing protein [Polyangiaceae bacterium]